MLQFFEDSMIIFSLNVDKSVKSIYYKYDVMLGLDVIIKLAIAIDSLHEIVH